MTSCPFFYLWCVPGADLVMSPDDAIAAWVSREFVGTSWRSFDVSEHESSRFNRQTAPRSLIAPVRGDKDLEGGQRLPAARHVGTTWTQHAEPCLLSLSRIPFIHRTLHKEVTHAHLRSSADPTVVGSLRKYRKTKIQQTVFLYFWSKKPRYSYNCHDTLLSLTNLR